jgi:hypothetical protein
MEQLPALKRTTAQKRRIWNWAKIVIIVYCAIGIGLYTFQDSFLFHPEKLEASHKFNFDQPFKEINIPVNKEDSINMVSFLPKAGVPAKGLVLYFHGNKQNIERYADFTKTFTEKGYEVWMPDYPGFGKSSGQLTEDKLYKYALLVRKMAGNKFSNDSIIVYGKSLGTGIAAYVASETQNKMLLLETPYFSIPSLFSTYAFIYPTQSMAKYKLPTNNFLEFTQEPVIIFHGDDDDVIPYRNAEKLKKYLKPTDKFYTIPDGTHHNINKNPIYFRVLDSLLNH